MPMAVLKMVVSVSRSRKEELNLLKIYRVTAVDRMNRRRVNHLPFVDSFLKVVECWYFLRFHMIKVVNCNREENTQPTILPYSPSAA